MATRPAAALAGLLLASALAGCGTNVASSFSTGGPIVAPTPLPAVSQGASVVYAGGLVASFTFEISATAANVIAAAGMLAIAIAADYQVVPPPKMREDRLINAQDCTRPIASWTANLKCVVPDAR
jgi:hypothetical protein